MLLGRLVRRVLVLVEPQEIVIQTGHCLAALLLGRLVQALNNLAYVFLVPQQRPVALRHLAQCLILPCRQLLPTVLEAANKCGLRGRLRKRIPGWPGLVMHTMSDRAKEDFVLTRELRLQNVIGVALDEGLGDLGLRWSCDHLLFVWRDQAALPLFRISRRWVVVFDFAKCGLV